MKKLGVILCILSLASNTLAQTQYENVSKVLGQLDAVMLSKDNNSRSKLKQIEFEEYGYSIESYFKMNTLEPGNPVFFSKLGNRKLILVGKVTKADKALTVNGVKFQDDGTMLYGLFQVSNSDNGSISYKPRKAGPLEITDIDLTFVSGSDHGTPVILDFKASNVYLDGKSGGREWLSLSSAIKNPSTFNYDQSVLRKVLMSLENDVEIEYSGRTFHGTVSVSDNSGKAVAITPLDGYATCTDGRTITVAASGKNVIMTISKADAKDLTYKLPSSQLSEEDWWNEPKFAQLYAASQAAAKADKSSSASKSQSAATAQAKPSGQQSDAAATDSATGSATGIPLYLYILAAAILLTIILAVTLRSRKK